MFSVMAQADDEMSSPWAPPIPPPPDHDHERTASTSVHEEMAIHIGAARPLAPIDPFMEFSSNQHRDTEAIFQEHPCDFFYGEFVDISNGEMYQHW